jgi:hypothetical protein
MYRRGQTTTFQERLTITERAAGQSAPDTAEALGCSVWTVRKWRRIGQPPLQAYPNAIHSGRSYRPEWELEMLDRERAFQDHITAPGE